jgi:hypothetical protein
MEFGSGIGLISGSARGGYAVHEMKCNGAMLVGCRRRLQLQRSTYLTPAILLAILVLYTFGSPLPPLKIGSNHKFTNRSVYHHT